MHKLTVEYTPKGQAVSDASLEKEYQIILARLQHNDIACRFSNETPFLRIRVGVKQGDIPHENVRFMFKDEEIAQDKDGRIDYWPDGFLDISEKLLLELI